jgi:hypothetical protein
MKSDTDFRSDAPSDSLWRGIVIVAATIPAAFLTWLGSSLSKDPSDFVRNWWFVLPLAVITAPSALAYSVEAGLSALDPKEQNWVGPVVSFVASVLLFLVIVFLVVD